MKISLEWLNEFVDITDLSVDQIVNALTMSGLEVEEIEKIGAKFTNITVAEIKNIEQHPNADKLHLVDINLGTEIKTVVCGAQNIQSGQIVPYAAVGSKVFSRKTGELFELTPAVIRGIESQGMLCSQDELGLDGLQEEDGILILNRLYNNLTIGQKLEEVLNIKEDTILDVSPTPNRGDQMSVIGVAREIAALFNKKLNFSKLECTKDMSTDKFEVEIIDEDTCKYYAVGLLKDITIKPSPDWLKRRLEVSGIRSINNVVDITNYVLLEYGNPLHAFDMDKLDGYICVRRAYEGETIVTLDGIERKLTHDSVLCADRNKPVCIAGVFGGENSEIDDNTKNIVLESACFTPATNRKNARSVGYRSEACARFERGVDITNTKPALLRAMQLLTELADAKAEGIVETGSDESENIEITLRFNQVKKILGIDIPLQKCIEILENLGFKLLGKNDIAAKFTTPSYRVNDVMQEIDLIEEIARIYGYDKIAPTLPQKTKSPDVTHQEKLMKTVNNILIGFGFNEITTSSLIGEPLLNQFGLTFDKEKAVYVQKPQSDEHTMLRQTTIANILNTIKFNFDNGQKDIWVYESGKTYTIQQTPTEKDSGVKETHVLSGALTGDSNCNLWKKRQKPDFYVLKGIIENLFSVLKISSRIKIIPSQNCEYLHPGRSAEIILLGKTPETIGFFGEIYPLIKDKMKINQDIFLFEINIGKVIKSVSDNVIKYKQLPQYPEVQRDISFAVDKNICNEQIMLAIKKSSNPALFKNANLFDIYEGEHIQDGFKSLAYRITLQSDNYTLTDEIIENEISSIKSKLKDKFNSINFR